MTPEGKTKPHTFLTRFSEILEGSSLYHQCSCKYFKILPRQDSNSVSQVKVASTTSITNSQTSPSVISFTTLASQKKTKQPKFTFIFVSLNTPLSDSNSFYYIGPLYHNCLELKVKGGSISYTQVTP